MFTPHQQSRAILAFVLVLRLLIIGRSPKLLHQGLLIGAGREHIALPLADRHCVGAEELTELALRESEVASERHDER